MDDIKALVIKNDMGLPADRVERLRQALSAKSATYLSPDREAGPFLLYCIGDDLDTIASKTGYPKDVIALTAIYYKWPDKAKLLAADKDSSAVMEVRKNLANMLLMATYISIQRQLGDIIAGRAPADSCPLMPSSIKELEQLMNLIDSVNKKVAEAKTESPQTIINATNVQLNQGVETQTAATRLELLKAIKD